MAKIRYMGDAPSVTWRDVTFHRAQWQAKHGLSDADVALLAGNPTFEVDDPPPAPEPEPAPAAEVEAAAPS